MKIASYEGVPISVAYWLQVEESGDRRTGQLGSSEAINKEQGKWPSVGLYQINTQPENINYLIDVYWRGRGEKEPFNPLDPIHSAKLGLRYLADLHRQFGSWYYAACAYNCGPQKLRNGNVGEHTKSYARRIVNAREPKYAR